MKTTKALFALLVVFIGLQADAQDRINDGRRRKTVANNLRVAMSPSDIAERAPRLTNLIQIDAFPMTSKGVGTSFEHAVTSRLLVGPYFSIFNLNGENDSNFDVNSRMMLYGLGGRYFLNDSFDRGAFYLQAGLGAVSVNTDTTARYLGQTIGSASASTTSLGYLAGFGYQFSGWSLGDGARLVTNLGAGYGNGYAVKYSASSNGAAPYGATSVQTSSEAAASLFFTLALGLLF